MRSLIGDRDFLKRTVAIAVPILIQNAITNFVSLLDNLMVGQLGTQPMSGVSIVNQLLFVFNLAIFGAIAGPGIFSAQFYGCNDQKGVRHTFRFKILFGGFEYKIGKRELRFKKRKFCADERKIFR